MLTELEQSVYAELFQTCDADGSGKISGGHAFELFRQSGLPHDVLQQVTELCGAKRLGHFGRSQFYIALKLIAVAQCGLPVTTDSINSGVDIPLPKFHKVSPSDIGAASGTGQSTADSITERQLQGQLPPPPSSAKKVHSRNLSGQFRGAHAEQPPQQILKDGQSVVPDTVSSPFLASQSQIPTQGPQPSVPLSVPISPPVAPVMTSSAGSQQLTLTGGIPETVQQSGMVNQIPLRGTEEWARFESDDEKHGLLGHGKKEGWDMKLPDFDSSSYSSDTESVEDVWSINDEQREYYVKQFESVEHDPNGHISGVVAKEFFEKSKLTNLELSKIWNLADLNHDGALSLEEFCIAMHLVVLRRNEIEIPERLPFSLMPYNAFTNDENEPFAADLPEGSTLKRLSPQTPPAGHWEGLVQDSPAAVSSSEVSSPSVTPANFDFQKPEPSDPEAHIVQPKAVRLSPDMLNEMPEVRPERGRAFSEPGPQSPESRDLTLPESDQPGVTKLRANTATMADTNIIDPTVHSRPRPLVKRNTVPGAMPGHILPPVPLSSHNEDRFTVTTSVDTEPPVPPPRPQNRSMSVDYKAPPAVPPRVSAKEAPGAQKLAHLKHLEPVQSQEVLNIQPGSTNVPPGSSAAPTITAIHPNQHDHTHSQERNKAGYDGGDGGADLKTAVAWDLLGPDFQDGSAERQTEFILAAQRQASRDKKELQMAIRTHKERNSTLSRLNSELNQELQEVMEQRIALEIQLEHLRPFSSYHTHHNS
ncbi:ralBP1-associated Eps domain-containing protein 1-like [Mya arenaria]|uniref:ralBP1-associated Eps domain-containing protein 1-like n=1 Tax=Mya arenaria TaxID=6604 RepID=UPI0022E5B2E5|nr:ralBP1-associated Eps domain-containing protein 1-like [Mya arenaria]